MSTVVTTGLRHTSYVGNNIILDSGGGVYAAGVVNATSYTVGASLVANTTGVYHTGTINAVSYTTGATGTGTGGLIANTTVLFLGNNTINATMNTTSLKIGGTFGIGGANALQGEFNATGLTVYAAGVTPQHDGPLHVMSGSAGAVTAATNYHDVVIEGSAGNVGVNILAPDASRSAFVMGSPTANEGAEINWKYSTGDMQIGTNKASTGLIGFYVADFSQRGEWNTTGLTCFASGVTPQHDGVLHVMSGSAGTISARSDADDLIIEAATDAGMSILTGDNAMARIRMTNPTDTNAGGALLAWDDSVSQFSMQTATAGSVLRFSTGAQQLSGEWNTTGLTVFASGVTPQHDGVLHAMKGSAGTVTSDTSYNTLVLESNASGGLSLLSADNQYSGIAFGSPTNNLGFQLIRRHVDAATYMGPNVANEHFVFRAGASQEVMRLRENSSGAHAGVIIGRGALTTAGDVNGRYLSIVQSSGLGALAQFQLRHEDVAHGMTSDATTTVFMTAGALSATTGGVTMNAWANAARAWNFNCSAVEDTNTPTTSVYGMFHVQTNKKSGTTTAAVSTTAALFTVGAGGVGPVFTVRGDGDVWNHGGLTTMQTYDTHDDRQLALIVRKGQGADVAKFLLNDMADRNAQALIDSGIAARNNDGSWYFSNRGLHALGLDYTRQLQDQVAADIEARLSWIQELRNLNPSIVIPDFAPHLERTIHSRHLPMPPLRT